MLVLYLEGVEQFLPYDGPPSPSRETRVHSTGSEAHRTNREVAGSVHTFLTSFVRFGEWLRLGESIPLLSWSPAGVQTFP